MTGVYGNLLEGMEYPHYSPLMNYRMPRTLMHPPKTSSLQVFISVVPPSYKLIVLSWLTIYVYIYIYIYIYIDSPLQTLVKLELFAPT